MPWAPEQPAYESDFYRFSIQKIDGRTLYQGLCMDISPTNVCEVRPGARKVTAKVELLGPWGRQSEVDSVSLTLDAGGVYFLRPDWSEAAEKRFRLQANRLPVFYTGDLRARLLNWLRRHTTGRSLE